jgi:hypothetical protein
MPLDPERVLAVFLAIADYLHVTDPAASLGPAPVSRR